MNEFKKEPMLTEIAEPQSAPPLGSETDLGALAEHLTIIADALRKSTVDTGSSDISRLMPPLQSALPTSGGSTGNSSGRAVGEMQPDAKMLRKHFGDLAREAYAVRRRRTAIFDNDELFGEPAWDILLDLYIANAENKSVSVSSACIGSAAPPTTGLRWLGVLSEQGLIAREHDPEDQRRVLVRLTDKGLTAMDEYFASLGLPP